MKNEIIFWVVVIAFLTLFFKNSFQQWEISFYFVSLLFPVVLGTSLFFNRLLVPRYLLKNRTFKFALYLIYMLIISLYLELIVIIVALVILANYKVANLGDMASNAYLLTAVMYLIVLIDGFVNILREFRDKHARLSQLQEERVRDARTTIVIKVNRKNVPIDVGNILVVESLSDYVKIHTRDQQYLTKQTISSLEASLPTHFLRVHRSFLVNQAHIDSFNRESVTIRNEIYPISRTYKERCLEVLTEEPKRDRNE